MKQFSYQRWGKVAIIYKFVIHYHAVIFNMVIFILRKGRLSYEGLQKTEWR
jgi:hypothetical protein